MMYHEPVLLNEVLENLKIEKNKIYTIWAKGLKNKTDSTKFGLAVLPHK